MQVNDALSCLGKCQGCVLMPDERTSRSPDMHQSMLEMAIGRMQEYAASLSPLRRVNVIFGIGDHILYGADYLVSLHEMGSRVVKAGRPSEEDRSVVFFTTSLVGRQDEVKALLRDIRDRMRGDVALVPQVVLDGRLMTAEKFGPKWRDMILEAKSLFGRVDLATNLSLDAVRTMSPAELAGFAESNGFNEVSVTWSPTLGNARQTMASKGEITDWLLEFDDLIESRPWIQTTYRPVIAKLLSSFAQRQDGQMPSMSEVVDDIVPESIAKAFEIDPSGHILSKFEAVGDVTHSPRHGLAYLGNIKDGPIADTISRAVPAIKAKIIGIHARGACASCHHAPVCAGTGFHVATYVGRKTGVAIDQPGEACPHIAAAVISRIQERVERGDASVACFQPA